MTNYNERLDEILKQNFSGNYEISCTRCSKSIDISYKPSKNAKQDLIDWHNRQVEKVLDRLDSSMPTPEQLTTKYGYHMPEKQYGYKIGLHDIREVIEAERAKLKENK